MKSIYKFSLVILTITSLFISSCGKYEDGPGFSFHTKKNRLSGDWKVESVTLNDADITTSFVATVGSSYMMDIEKDGAYNTTGSYPDSGTWKLGEDGDDVFFTSSTAGSTQESYRILRLKTKELWLKHTESNGDVYIFKYEAE